MVDRIVARLCSHGLNTDEKENYMPEDEPQLLNELKATGIKVGLLVNFSQTKVEFKRMVF